MDEIDETSYKGFRTLENRPHPYIFCNLRQKWGDMKLACSSFLSSLPSYSTYRFFANSLQCNRASYALHNCHPMTITMLYIRHEITPRCLTLFDSEQSVDTLSSVHLVFHRSFSCSTLYGRSLQVMNAIIFILSLNIVNCMFSFLTSSFSFCRLYHSLYDFVDGIQLMLLRLLDASQLKVFCHEMSLISMTC